MRRKRAGADGGFTTVQLHADKNRRAPHGHVADPAWPLLEGTCPTIPLTLSHCPQKIKKGDVAGGTEKLSADARELPNVEAVQLRS